MKKVAYVKKYKAVFNLVLSLLISLVLSAVTFLILFDDGFWAILGIILASLLLIGLSSYCINVFITQNKFNKSQPEYYIDIVDDATISIKGKNIKIDTIKKITYKKLRNWELFGEIKDSDVGATPLPVYKFEEKMLKKISDNAIKKHEEALKKSKLGTLIVHLESSKIVLKRINNIDDVVAELNSVIKTNKGDNV